MKKDNLELFFSVSISVREPVWLDQILGYIHNKR